MTTTLSFPVPSAASPSGVFVGCNVWNWNITLDAAFQIASENDLTAEDTSESVWFQNAQGECVAYWRPLND